MRISFHCTAKRHGLQIFIPPALSLPETHSLPRKIPPKLPKAAHNPSESAPSQKNAPLHNPTGRHPSPAAAKILSKTPPKKWQTHKILPAATRGNAAERKEITASPSLPDHKWETSINTFLPSARHPLPKGNKTPSRESPHTNRISQKS